MNSPLELIVNFFGHLGVQLHPVEWQNWRSAVRFIWNILLGIVTLYVFYALDPLGAKAYHIEYSNPWHVLAAFDTVYLYPIAYHLTIGYYFCFGHQIVQLLKSAHFAQHYPTDSQAKYVSGAIVCLQHCLFFMLFLNVLSFDYSQITLEHLLCSLCNYLVYTNLYITLVFTYYAQHGTWRSLSLTLQSIRIISESETRKRIRALALTSSRLYGWLSFPLGIFVFSAIIDAITSICIAKFAPNFETFLQWGLTLLYILYQIYLNTQIDLLLKQIGQHYRHMNTNLFTPTFKVTPGRSASESSASRQIPLYELDIYSAYFPLKLFHLCTVDYEFFLSMVLLIFNYTVLIIQTSPPESFESSTVP